MSRDCNGRFVKGKSGNPNGRPKKKEFEKDYLEVTIDAVALTDWKDIVIKAKNQAIKGDGVARKWLADHLLGLPTQNIDMKHKGKILLWDWQQKAVKPEE